MTEKRFIKYDGNTIVDLKLVKSWIINNGNVELLLEILNNEKTPKEIIRKKCTDCKHTKGIGYDFWCDEGHTEYEVFGGETNCPYYEYHDWSKDTPSKTEKQFTFNKDTVATNLKTPITYNNKTMSIGGVLEKLNELADENEELKKEVKVYRKVASCSNCKYHNYDWYDDGDEFEVCDNGNNVNDGICEEWDV